MDGCWIVLSADYERVTVYALFPGDEAGKRDATDVAEKYCATVKFAEFGREDWMNWSAHDDA